MGSDASTGVSAELRGKSTWRSTWGSPAASMAASVYVKAKQRAAQSCKMPREALEAVPSKAHAVAPKSR